MPRRHPSRSAVLAVAGVLWLAAAVPAPAAPPPAKVDYNFQVRPLLADRCFVCHGPDEKKRKAKLRLDDPAVARRVLVPGKPERERADPAHHRDRCRRAHAAARSRTSP